MPDNRRKPLEDDVEIRCDTMRRVPPTPRFRRIQLVNTNDRTYEDVPAFQADGLQIGLEEITGSPEIPPFVSIAQHFGEGALYTSYDRPEDVEAFIKGMQDALDALRIARKEWEERQDA